MRLQTMNPLINDILSILLNSHHQISRLRSKTFVYVVNTVEGPMVKCASISVFLLNFNILNRRKCKCNNSCAITFNILATLSLTLFFYAPENVQKRTQKKWNELVSEASKKRRRKREWKKKELMKYKTCK